MHLFDFSGILDPFTTIEARKAEVLPKLLAEVEAALPVLRAMVRNLEAKDDQ